MLAFHGAREKARNEIALNERVQKDERESDDDEDGKESSGICHIHPGVLHGNESNGFVVAVSHHDKCQKEFVPCHDELPDGDEDQRRLYKRERNMEEHLQSRAPINHSGFKQVARRIVHERFDYDDSVRDAEGRVGQNKPLIGIDPAERPQHDRKRQDDGCNRHHQRGQQDRVYQHRFF